MAPTYPGDVVGHCPSILLEVADIGNLCLAVLALRRAIRNWARCLLLGLLLFQVLMFARGSEPNSRGQWQIPRALRKRRISSPADQPETFPRLDCFSSFLSSMRSVSAHAEQPSSHRGREQASAPLPPRVSRQSVEAG
jgi:hypothetical protein